jgi:hypothetical protein
MLTGKSNLMEKMTREDERRNVRRTKIATLAEAASGKVHRCSGPQLYTICPVKLRAAIAVHWDTINLVVLL